MPVSFPVRPAANACLLGSVLSALVMPAAALAAEDADNPGEIVVRGDRPEDFNPNANPDAPYKVERSQNDKFTESLRDTPRSVTVISKEVIEDLGANSFREVVRSTPGITLGTGEGGNAFGDRIFIRGFEARNDVYIDGLRDPGVTSREIFAVEQIEIVKGPSGSFGGRGTTGGLVSLESKRATPGLSFVTADLGVGTDQFGRITVDANHAVSDKFAIRVNALYHTADTPGRDFAKSEKWGVAAAATLNLTDTMTLSADYYRARLDGIPDFGHPFDVTTQQPYNVRRDNFYGVIGRDFLRNGADIGTFRVDWQPVDGLELRSVTRVGETYNRYIVGTPGSVCRFARTSTGACPTTGAAIPEDQYTITAGGQRRWATNNYVANVTDATARFDTGGIGHTLVLGGEFARETVENLPLAIPAFVEDSAGNPIPAPGTFIRNLLTPDPVLGFDFPVVPDTTNGPSRAQVKSLAAYAIDTIKFTPQFWLTLGARIDAYDITFRANELPTTAQLSSSATFANWQASATFKPVDAMTLYASWATSANPSGEQLDGNGISYDGLAPQTANLDPERNESLEAGAKWETSDGKLLLTAAAFQITKNNARENIGGNVYELVGKLRSRGFELGASGKLFDVLQLFGGYTYTDAKIVESINAANVGRAFANIPKHSANLLATFLLSQNLEVGGQVHYQSEFFGGSFAAGTARVPGYTRLDAVARYKPLSWLEARLNVNNLTDETYYDAIYRSGSPFAYVAPGRSAVFTLTARY
ncbi:TonB-dependent receptor [Tsuneonella sp. HG094]